MSLPPRYLTLHESGELARRADALEGLLDPCRLCPRQCGARRLAGERGECGVGAEAVVARACHHRGEEPPLSGERGAGTIFFAGCNLGCGFCQNHVISSDGSHGRALDADGLADEMLALQAQGVHNIAWVTASHVVAQAVRALDRAAAQGLSLPLVYNTSAYDRLEVIRLLADVVDVYLPDLKYGVDPTHPDLARVDDYVAVSQAAVRQMHEQVGRLRTDEDGLAWRGLILRHLVLPEDLSGTEAVLRFVATELGPGTHLSLMAQYRPPARRNLTPPLDRALLPAEYERATDLLVELGLDQGWVQELSATDTYVPDFDAEDHPFEQ